jgi:hypothetical protein
MYGLDPKDESNSSDSDVSLTSTKQKIESDPVRKARLKERRQRRKKTKTDKVFPDNLTNQAHRSLVVSMTSGGATGSNPG